MCAAMIIQTVATAKRATAVCPKVVARVYPALLGTYWPLPRPKVTLGGCTMRCYGHMGRCHSPKGQMICVSMVKLAIAMAKMAVARVLNVLPRVHDVLLWPYWQLSGPNGPLLGSQRWLLARMMCFYGDTDLYQGQTCRC